MTPGADTKTGSLLLERERELQALERALDRLAEGVGSMLLVEGPAGIGKTRLLGELARLARERNLLVRAARGGQLEREMPFGVARQLLEPVVERASEAERSELLSGSAGLALIALGRDDPERTGPAGDPFAPIHGLYWLVANLAEEQALVLVVDDAHWGDAQTLRFLDYLARRLSDTAVLVLAGVRSGEPDEPSELEPLRLEAEVLHPAPLSPTAVDELIAAQLGKAPTAEFSNACAKATGGNPFLLAEVLRTLRADATDPGAEASAAIEELGPEAVAHYVLMRLGRFGNDAISLTRAVAILGGAPQLRHAATLARLEEQRAAELCEALREAEILAPGLPIEFVHPLVRSVIYREQSEEERSAGHRRAAELLSSTGSAARDIAPHLMAVAPNGDQWVVSLLGEAAKQAIAAGAPDGAEAYLERALEEPPDDEVPLLYRLGRALMETDPDRAPSVLDEVADRASDLSLRLRALRLAAVSYLNTGDLAKGIPRLSTLFDAVAENDREVALLLEAQLFTLRCGHAGRDPAISRRIRAVAAGTGAQTPGECFVRQALSFEHFQDCAPVGEVVALASSHPPPEWGIRAAVPALGSKVLAASGRWDLARGAAERYVEAARASGALITVSWHLGFLSEVDRRAGRLPDAESEARTAWEIAEEVAPHSLPWWGAIANLVAVLVSRGALEEADRLASEVDLSAGLSEVHSTPWPLEARGYLRLALGELEAGAGDLLALGDEAERWRYFNPGLAPWRQEVAPALAALDRTAEGEEIIAVAEERARAFGAPHLLGIVLRSRALLEPRKRQIETLRESVQLLGGAGPPHELARSLLELGSALRRDGRRSDSREPLRKALELANRSGAGGLERRAREELAAAGSRPRSVLRTGVASLTASELRTAKLAAEGLSNVEIAQRLFVTRKTVEKHLGNAYMKLEISSRDELPAALDEDLPTSD